MIFGYTLLLTFTSLFFMQTADDTKAKQSVLSGIQPTGQFHLGNYFGAVRQWVKMTERYDCMYMVVDMHAISVPQNPAQLRQDSLNCLAQLIAWEESEMYTSVRRVIRKP